MYALRSSERRLRHLFDGELCIHMVIAGKVVDEILDLDGKNRSFLSFIGRYLDVLRRDERFFVGRNQLSPQSRI
jgi:hypothetical protein